MNRIPIALGMYTVHKRVAQDLAGTLQALARMGYQGIEFYGEPSDFPPELVNSALKESGLELASWHIEWRNLQPESIERSIEYFKKVGLTRVIIPCLGGQWNVAHNREQECEQVWRDYLPKIEGIRARLAAEGIRLGYHNHEHEFKLRYSGQSVFDLLYGSFAPDMIMEFDTGNAIEGGSDPGRVMAQHAARKKQIHLKPWSRQAGFEVTLGDPGDENDYPAIIAAAGESCEWLIVESEDFRTDELDNAQKCLEALKRLLKEQ